jgi:hypothetical protein
MYFDCRCKCAMADPRAAGGLTLMVCMLIADVNVPWLTLELREVLDVMSLSPNDRR